MKHWKVTTAEINIDKDIVFSGMTMIILSSACNRIIIESVIMAPLKTEVFRSSHNYIAGKDNNAY